MIPSLFLPPLGLLLGLDSFRATAMLALLPMNRRTTVTLVIAFGVCDGTATLVGILVGNEYLVIVAAHIRLAGALMITGYGLWLVRATDSADELGRLTLVLPILLSVDNLGAGVALGAARVDAPMAAILLGVSSSLLAGLGLLAGRLVAKRLPFDPRRVVGIVVIGLAVATSTGLV